MYLASFSIVPDTPVLATLSDLQVIVKILHSIKSQGNELQPTQKYTRFPRTKVIWRLDCGVLLREDIETIQYEDILYILYTVNLVSL